MSKNSKIELEILKPTKFFCQTSKWAHLLNIKDKVVDTFRSGGGSDSFMALIKAANALKKSEATLSGRGVKPNDTFSKFQHIRDIMGKLDVFIL